MRRKSSSHAGEEDAANPEATVTGLAVPLNGIEIRLWDWTSARFGRSRESGGDNAAFVKMRDSVSFYCGNLC
jgi:hypothetical protein